MKISLPDSLKSWVEEKATQAGFQTPDEYVFQVLQQEKERERRIETEALLREAHGKTDSEIDVSEFLEAQRQGIEAKLTAAMKSGPSTPMTAQDWDEIRREVRERRERRNGQ